MGFWHGAAWTFVISGVYNGFLLVFENITKLNKEKPGFFYNLFKRIYTLIAIILGLLFFRAKTIQYAWDYILNLFGLLKRNDSIYTFSYYVERVEIIVIIFAILCSVPIFKNILFWGKNHKFVGLIVDIWLIIILVLSCMQIAASTYNPFIYFRF